MFDLTEKQKQFLFYEGKRLNFLSGSVRSGKTFVSLLKFCLWIAEQPLDHEFIMVGKTIGSLRRNCFGYITQLIGESNFKYTTSTKTAYIFGRLVYLEGANNERSEQSIRGMTLAGAYCDEVTLYPESFFSMLLSRLSVAGAKLWATCNPDTPTHYIKKNYIDREDELDCICWNFILTENNFLPQEYIDSVSKEYTGVFYDRFILGKWIKAEGLIYPMYDKVIKHVDIDFSRVSIRDMRISLDYGTLNAFCAILWIKTYFENKEIWYAERCYYYSGKAEGRTKTDIEYGNDLDIWLADILKDWDRAQGKIKIIVDPSAASFISLLNKKSWCNVIHADNNVIDGIRETATAMQTGKILVNPEIKEFEDEMAGYAWEDDETVERPIKINDHLCDAVRYFCKTMHIAQIKRE